MLLQLTNLISLDLLCTQASNSSILNILAPSLPQSLQKIYINLPANSIIDNLNDFSSSLKNLKSLKKLYMTFENIDESMQLNLISALGELSQLEELYLRLGSLGFSVNVGTAFTTAQQNLKSLKLLNLNNNNIGMMTIDFWSKLCKSLNLLTKLDLSNNNMTDSGINFFSQQFSHLSSLQELILDNNNITAIGAEYIANEMVNLSSLNRLELNDNYFTDVGAIKLVNSITNLSVLSLNNNIITQNGINQLTNTFIYSIIPDTNTVRVISLSKLPEDMNFPTLNTQIPSNVIDPISGIEYIVVAIGDGTNPVFVYKSSSKDIFVYINGIDISSNEDENSNFIFTIPSSVKRI